MLRFPPFCLHIPILSHVPKPNPCHTPDCRSSEHHQLSWQLNGLLALKPESVAAADMSHGMSRYDVITQGVGVHMFGKSRFYARAFLVHGIVERIGKPPDTLSYHLPAHPVAHRSIYFRKLVGIVTESLELYSLNMIEKKDV